MVYKANRGGALAPTHLDLKQLLCHTRESLSPRYVKISVLANYIPRKISIFMRRMSLKSLTKE